MASDEKSSGDLPASETSRQPRTRKQSSKRLFIGRVDSLPRPQTGPRPQTDGPPEALEESSPEPEARSHKKAGGTPKVPARRETRAVRRARLKRAAQKPKGTRSSGAKTNAGQITQLAGAVKSGFVAFVDFIRSVWRFAERVDGRIWRFLKATFGVFALGVTVITDWIFDASKSFLAWLPTPAGQGYCAFFGMIVIVASLGITDRVRGAALTLQSAQAGNANSIQRDQQDPVMARIGGAYIRLSEVEAAARSAGTLQDGESLSIDSEFTRELVSTFVDQRILAEAAQQIDLDTETMMQGRLRAARDRILAAAYIDTILNDRVSDERVRALFEAQSDITSLGEEIRIRHILVSSRAEAASILKAVENGADFTALARGRSLDRGTAPHGGDTGYITRDMVSNEFGRIAFAIDQDAISPPFRTSEGWNVIKVLEKREIEGISYAAVEDDLRRFLTLRAIDETLETLKDNFDVVIYDQESEPSSSTSSLAKG